MTSERIVFAHLLRGVGAVSVLISHYVGIFWIAHPEISALMGVPVVPDFPSLDFPFSVIGDNCIIFGQFGVGVFFLVSGLVIPFSIESATRVDFLVRRAMRIYPVYIVGFSLVVLSLYALASYTGVPFKFSLADIVAHFGVITRGPLGVDRIDGISWTLEVEIYFYLVMCVLGAYVLKFRVQQYIAAAVVIAIAAALAMKSAGYLIGVQVGSGLLLLLGIAYYSVMKQRIGVKDFWIFQVVVIALLMLLWLGFARFSVYTMRWLGGYLLAVAVFHTCYVLRQKITANLLLSHLSDISYPLYVVHALFGYAIMYVFVDLGFGFGAAVAAASVAAYAAALLIHLLVEKPAMDWAKTGRRKDSLLRIG